MAEDLQKIAHGFLDNFPPTTKKLELEVEGNGVKLSIITTSTTKADTYHPERHFLHKVIYDETWDERKGEKLGRMTHWIKEDVDDGNRAWYLFDDTEGNHEKMVAKSNGNPVTTDEILVNGQWKTFPLTPDAMDIDQKGS